VAYFKQTTFGGLAPIVTPRLLAESYAQVANNVEIESGRLSAEPLSKAVVRLADLTHNHIYLYEDVNWLSWVKKVSVASGPIPDDTNGRLYWTGDDYPRISDRDLILSGAGPHPAGSYRLGIPAPSVAPLAVAETGTGLGDTPQDSAYVYTYVSVYGEEGPPSPPSDSLELIDSGAVLLTFPTLTGLNGVYPGNYHFEYNPLIADSSKIRIYRANTGSNSTEFQFLDEIQMNATSYLDIKSSTQLGEVLPSNTWIGPPNDDGSLYPNGPLQGLIAIANGGFAGFSGKRFCLSEPFLPHAWPIEYRITTEEDIVAISGTSNGVIALTDGAPYFITGTDPSSMTAIRVDLAQACINVDSVVDMGEYVLYCGPDGLVSVQGTQGGVITRDLVSFDDWNDDFYPDIVKCFRHEGTYVAFWEKNGVCGGWRWDPRSQQATLTTTGSLETPPLFNADGIGPIITLSGPSTVTLQIGDSYVDAGAQAIDDVDGVISSLITVYNPVDTSTAGSYTVTYNVSDEAGNPALQVERTVSVTAIGAPVITLLGDASVQITAGQTYSDAGATATDAEDGDLTGSITAINTVDTNVAGNYTVTYFVTDSNGNNALTVTRAVEVLSSLVTNTSGDYSINPTVTLNLPTSGTVDVRATLFASWTFAMNTSTSPEISDFVLFADGIELARTTQTVFDASGGEPSVPRFFTSNFNFNPWVTQTISGAGGTSVYEIKRCYPGTIIEQDGFSPNSVAITWSITAEIN
jgi:hypothetical protein